MKKKFFHKCILTLGLLIFFTMFLPVIGFNTYTAMATSIDASKRDGSWLNLKSVTLVKGKSFALNAYNLPEKAQIIFKSDDKEIASVSDEGVITANKVGNTTIRAIIKSDLPDTELTCDVIVGPPAFSIKITKSRLIVGVDKSDFLNVILKPSNTVELAKFSTKGKSSVVSVSSGGRITGKSLGLAYVFAEIDATDSTGARRYDTCTVIVANPEDVTHLEEYFNDHPELDLIPKDELTSALDEYFNEKYPSLTTSVVNSLNSYLDGKFNLAELRVTREANISRN